MFSSKARQLINHLKKKNCDPGISSTYLFARGKGFRTDYFSRVLEPWQEELLEQIPKGYIFDEKLDPEWVKKWMKLWPTMGQVAREGYQLEYSISGHAPEVKKRMPVFVKEFCERMGMDESDCDMDYKLDIIWKATEAYLQNLRDTGYRFPKKNHKFIKDLGGSILEEWCQRVVSGQVKEAETTFRI